MRCAKCSGELEVRKVEATTVNQCGKCHGVWFDWREMDAVLRGGGLQMLDHGDHPAADIADAKAGTCPRCDQALERFDSLAVEGLHFDQCGGCRGVWLDSGELRRLASDATAAAIGGFFTNFS